MVKEGKTRIGGWMGTASRRREIKLASKARGNPSYLVE